MTRSSLLLAAALLAGALTALGGAAQAQTPAPEPTPTHRVDFTVVDVFGKRQGPSLERLPILPRRQTRSQVPLRSDFRAALAASADAL
jgi:hypothetical protein